MAEFLPSTFIIPCSTFDIQKSYPFNVLYLITFWYCTPFKLIISTQVDRLKTVRKKRALKPCLVQESDVSAKVRQSCSSDPFSLQSKQLQSDYVSSHDLLFVP